MRLNNGEPLTGAEKRNAMGGKMCQLIRDIAGHRFFSRRHRFQHRTLPALRGGGEIFAHGAGRRIVRRDLLHFEKAVSRRDDEAKPRNDQSGGRRVEKIRVRNSGCDGENFRRIAIRFCAARPHRRFTTRFAAKSGGNTPTKHCTRKIHSFLEGFHRKRLENLRNEDEDARDPELINFDRLMLQNNDSGSMRERVRILTRHFLADHSDVALKDSRRNFDEDERYVVWLQGGKKCVECGVTILLKDMDADHIKPHAHGGKTILSNARALCVNCNRSGGARARQPQTTQQRAA